MGSPAAPGGVESNGQDWGCLNGIWEGRACKLSQKELSFQIAEAALPDQTEIILCLP